MATQSLHAVITGDLVDSTKLEEEQSVQLINVLKSSFDQIAETLEEASFDIFRGDSFQGLIKNPAHALSASLIIRSSLRALQPENSPVSWDARTAIGIGTIDSWPENVSEGNGEAFQKSGPLLDRMKSDERLLIDSPWEEVNHELNAHFALLDAIIAKWSPQQAEIVFELMRGHSRKQISNDLGISQAAVSYRVKGAGWSAVEKLLEQYRRVVEKQVPERALS